MYRYLPTSGICGILGARLRNIDYRTKADAIEAPVVAVLIPCHNEETTIGDVVRRFRKELPEAAIYVFDNNSSDRTPQEARDSGAISIEERRQGKGYVVQSMFRKVVADIYVMVDGDGTYPADAVERLIAPVLSG